MKTYELRPGRFCRALITMVLFFALFSLMKTVNAQENKTKISVSPGFGIGAGVFFPEDVNNYISDILSDYITTNADIFMNFDLKAFLSIKMKWVELEPVLEYALAPKMFIGSDVGTLNFTRVSPGMVVNFFIPIKSGRNALFLGGGLLYHSMTFNDGENNEKFKGEKLGFRIQMGFDLQLSKITIQPTLAVNIANADNADIGHLNYSGGQIGVNFSFHKPVYHK